MRARVRPFGPLTGDVQQGAPCQSGAPPSSPRAAETPVGSVPWLPPSIFTRPRAARMHGHVAVAPDLREAALARGAIHSAAAAFSASTPMGRDCGRQRRRPTASSIVSSAVAASIS